MELSVSLCATVNALGSLLGSVTPKIILANSWYLMVAFTVSVIVLFRNITITRTNLRLPPQPPGYPVFGHLCVIVRENKANRWHMHLNTWARRYGPIFGVRTGYVVDYYVNSDKLIKELFDKRSAQTADRPEWIMSREILNNGYNTLFLHASDPRWKIQRRVIHTLLTSVPSAHKIVPFLDFESLKFLHENADSSSGGLSGEKLFKSIGRYTYSAFSTAIMGMDIPDTDDPSIEFIKETEIQIFNTFPGFNIIDLCPFLGKLPLFLKPWERKGRARYRRDLDWSLQRLNKIKELGQRDNMLLDDSFLGSILRDPELMGISCEEELAILGFAMIAAAADTSRMTTWSFLEAMMEFPEVQKKAQTEIDRVVGNRIPVYEDFRNLPYFRMMMKEVWRWRPPVSLGHPHITTRAMQLGEFHLPKGSRLHINAYAIGHDPERHENPEQFWPERFADDNTTTMESINSKDATQRDHFAFGSGRRVCPGYHVAERSAALAMMRILWSFNIHPIAGTKTPLNFLNYPGAIPGNPADNMPVKFECRSQERKHIIKLNYEEERSKRGQMLPLNMGEKFFRLPAEYL